ncbi:hypothetical protein VU05_00255 [Desulfobulbus sp. F1]|nr:hypothetical protein [Desulfobulbus sp. F1]
MAGGGIPCSCHTLPYGQNMAIALVMMGMEMTEMTTDGIDTTDGDIDNLIC